MLQPIFNSLGTHASCHALFVVAAVMFMGPSETGKRAQPPDLAVSPTRTFMTRGRDDNNIIPWLCKEFREAIRFRGDVESMGSE